MIQLFVFNEISRASIYGIGTYIQQLISFLDMDYQINIVNYYSDKPEFTIINKASNIRELYIPRNQLKYEDGKCTEVYFLNAVYLLSDYIDPNNKIIFHFNHFRYSSMLKMLKEYWPSCKIIMSIHYLNWCFQLKGNLNYFKYVIHHCSDKNSSLLEQNVLSTYKDEMSFLNEIDQIVCLSMFAKMLLFSEYHISENKLLCVYNGMNDGEFVLHEREKSNLKQKLYISLQEKVILFVGRLDDIKGIDSIILSFKKLLLIRDDCQLIVVGDGDFIKLLDVCNDDWKKIVFTGKLSKDDLYQFYQIADVGVMLSKHEQCSYVAIEMMMYGLPIIASNSTGLNEMVVDGLNGFKINTVENKDEVTFDTDQCCLLMNRLVSLGETDRNKMRLASRKFFEDHYSLELMKQKMLSVYESL